jgi:hypothetical protein
MARSASTGFTYYKSLSGNTAAPTSIPIRVANSTTLTLGDAVRVNTSGLAVLVGAGSPVGGIVVGLYDEKGMSPFALGYDLSVPSCTLSGDDTVVTASDNSSRAHYIMAAVVIDPAGDILWLNDADDDVAQTNLFQHFDVVAASDQIDVATASEANGQFQLIALDPEATGGVTANASKGVFRIAENQFGLGIDSATAKTAA